MNLRNMAKTTTVIALILLMASVTLRAMPAQALPAWNTSPPAGVTPSVTVKRTPFMSFRPNPVGIGQAILVNLWIEPPNHFNRYFSGYTVTITKPDGTTDTVGPMNSYQGDTTAWFEYVVDQVGKWKLKFNAPGNYYPAGYYTPDALVHETSVPLSTFLDSAYYEPCSTAEQELTVQGEPVLSWPPAPLPTDYWTRPIPIENREWWIIGGHYPFIGQGGGPYWPADTNVYASNYKFTPYVQAPNTAHIVWKRQGALAGIMGGQFGYRSYGPGEGTYAGTPSIIFQGRCYQTINKVVNGETTSVWQCYDLRTGEVCWERTGVTAPTTIIYNRLGPSVPGAGETGIGKGGSWGFVHLTYIGGGRLIKYDPWTGAVAGNVSISPLTTGTVYMEPYVLSVQTIGTGAATQYRLINWSLTDVSQTGALLTMAERIVSNITYPFSSLGTCDFESMIAVSTQSIISPGTGSSLGARVMGASLKTGALLFNVTTNDIIFSGSTGVADHGKYTVRMLGGWWDCWDLHSGKLVWQSEKPAYPWGDFGAYTIASYAGMFYDQSYAGLYAFNWTNGKIVWHYDAGYPGYEAAFTSYPFFTNLQIADGKLYIANGEHSPTQPLMRGWKLHCINATTGEGIWNITGGGTAGAVADGYLTFDSRYDGYMYVFGKGKSATTIQAPLTAITEGQSIVLTGTVLDLSPGQPNTACVSKDSMSAWMEYLHMQKPMPANVTGVPVSLDTLDPNGNFVHIATVTTDASGTFSCLWEPEVPGKYTVSATFLGDDSYGSSFAETAIFASEAPPATPPPPQPQPAPDPTPTIIGAAIAIIIAVALAAIWIKKK